MHERLQLAVSADLVSGSPRNELPRLAGTHSDRLRQSIDLIQFEIR